MARFDVHRTIGANRRAAPYLITVQSNRLERLPARIVIPLVHARPGGDFDDALGPPFEIEGVHVRLAPWRIFTIPITALGPVATSLSSDRETRSFAKRSGGSWDDILRDAPGR